jgi:hypothetical protein
MDDSTTPSRRRSAVRRHNRQSSMYAHPPKSATTWHMSQPRNNSFTNNLTADTEIDWSTYMQQIAIFLKGERDYRKIEGSTGPLVYPGAHVWIYKQLYKITDEGRNIQLAQYLFALVYLGTLALVIQCYRRARVCCSFHFQRA